MAIHVAAAAAPESAPAATDLQHVFVSVRGIEAQSVTPSADDSPDWQDLAPALHREPQQVDLLAPKAQVCMRGPLSLANVPAGTYRQVRISLVADPPADGEPVPATNRCGAVGLHCVITSNGDVRPLIWNGASDNLQFVSAEAADVAAVAQNDFRVLPDAQTTLTLSFTPFAAMRIPSSAAFHLAPVFTASSGASCESN